MARKCKDPKEIKLAHPDRSGPTEKTLLQWAEERELFAQAEARERQAKPKSKGQAKEGGDEDKSKGSGRGDEEDEALFTPGQERVLEAAMWAATLSTVHLMLDVLVQNQYAAEIDLTRVAVRTGQAFLGTFPPPPFSPLSHPSPPSPLFPVHPLLQYTCN